MDECNHKFILNSNPTTKESSVPKINNFSVLQSGMLESLMLETTEDAVPTGTSTKKTKVTVIHGDVTERLRILLERLTDTGVVISFTSPSFPSYFDPETTRT